jgi:hypothetical protein
MDVISWVKQNIISGSEATIEYDITNNKFNMINKPYENKKDEEIKNKIIEYQKLNAVVKPTLISVSNVPVSAINAPVSAINVPVSAINAPVSAINAPISFVTYPLGCGATGSRGATGSTGPSGYYKDCNHKLYNAINGSVNRASLCGCTICTFLSSGRSTLLLEEMKNSYVKMKDYPLNVKITIDFSHLDSLKNVTYQDHLKLYNVFKEFLLNKVKNSKFDKIECKGTPEIIVQKYLNREKVKPEMQEKYSKLINAINFLTEEKVFNDYDDDFVHKIPENYFVEEDKEYMNCCGVTIDIYATREGELYDYLYSQGLISKAFEKNIAKTKFMNVMNAKLNK